MIPIPTVSPVHQDFVWYAEYADGTHLSEFDFWTKQENSFHQIDRSKLIRFGLTGHDMKLFFEVFGGHLKLSGKLVDLVYKAGGKTYHLTGQPRMYNEILTYKDAESFITLDGRRGPLGQINQFNVGYQTRLEFDDVTFDFKAVCNVPYGQPVTLTVSLFADRDLEDGVLQVVRYGQVIDELKADLHEEAGGELRWVVR